MREVLDAKANPQGLSDRGLVEEAFRFGPRARGGGVEVGLDLNALAGAVVNVVGGVDAKEERTSGADYTAHFGEGRNRFVPGQVVKRKRCEGRIEARITKGQRETEVSTEEVSCWRVAVGHGEGLTVEGEDAKAMRAERLRVEPRTAAEFENSRAGFSKDGEKWKKPAVVPGERRLASRLVVTQHSALGTR